MIVTETCWLRTAMQPSAFYSETSGIYASGAGPRAWAILGTVALSQTVPAEAVQYLSDTNSTAYVFQALRAAGEDPVGPSWRKGANNPVTFMLARQLLDGSFE